jgi:hypothetical protein
MKLRILIGTIVGTVVAFTYGFVTWAVLDLWADKIQSMPPSVDMGALVSKLPADGAYHFPGFDKEAAKGDAAQALWDQYEVEHEKGPIGLLLVSKQGKPSMGASTFISSLGMDAVCALLMAFFVAGTACPSWPGRWTYGVMVALFAAVASNSSDLAWFDFPSKYVLYDMADLFLKWTVASAAVAAVVGGSKSCPFHAGAPKPA